MTSPGLKIARWERVHRPGASRRTNCCSAASRASIWCSCRATAAATSSRRPAINYRANIDALKRVGVTDVISVSACGSLREELPPGTFVDRRPVHRPHLCPREKFLRPRLRRACADGASGLPKLCRRADAACAGRRDPSCARRHLYLPWKVRNSPPAPKSNLYRSWGCA